MRVLVTGGAGFLGKNVVGALLEKGHDPVLLVRGGRRPGLPEMAEVIDGDVRDADVFQSAAQGCQAILHSAAMVKLWSSRPEDFDDINVGRDLMPRRLSYGLSRLVGRALWLWADVTGKPPDLTHQAVGIFEKHWAYRSDKAVRELDYTVRPLAEGIGATVDWLIATERG